MKKLLCIAFISIVCLAAATATVSAGEYDLASYLALVDKNNPDLLVKFKDIDSAKSDVALARSAFLPRANLQGGYTRNFRDQLQSYPVASLPGGGSLVWQDIRTNFDNELSLGIGVSQVLLNAGAISNYNKAKLAQAIREQSYEAARQAILCAAKKLYASAQLTQLVIEIRESSERLSLEQYQRVERRNQAGASTELDLLQAEVDHRTKIDAVTEAKKNNELVLLAFRDLAGIPHSETVTLTEEHTGLPGIPVTPDLNNILAGRADYRALSLSRDISGIDRNAARNAFVPQIAASFNWSLGGMGNGSDFTTGYNYNLASLGVFVSIPILTGGERLARMDAAKAAQEKSIIALSQKETAIESELMGLQLRLEDAKQQSESSLQTVETARRALALAQTAYTNGQATYLNVMDAQDKADLVWLNFANLTFEYLSAYYDWELATGVK